MTRGIITTVVLTIIGAISIYGGVKKFSSNKLLAMGLLLLGVGLIAIDILVIMVLLDIAFSSLGGGGVLILGTLGAFVGVILAIIGALKGRKS